MSVNKEKSIISDAGYKEIERYISRKDWNGAIDEIFQVASIALSKEVNCWDKNSIKLLYTEELVVLQKYMIELGQVLDLDERKEALEKLCEEIDMWMKRAFDVYFNEETVRYFLLKLCFELRTKIVKLVLDGAEDKKEKGNPGATSPEVKETTTLQNNTRKSPEYSPLIARADCFLPPSICSEELQKIYGRAQEILGKILYVTDKDPPKYLYSSAEPYHFVQRNRSGEIVFEMYNDPNGRVLTTDDGCDLDYYGYNEKNESELWMVSLEKKLLKAFSQLNTLVGAFGLPEKQIQAYAEHYRENGDTSILLSTYLLFNIQLLRDKIDEMKREGVLQPADKFFPVIPIELFRLSQYMGEEKLDLLYNTSFCTALNPNETAEFIHQVCKCCQLYFEKFYTTFSINHIPEKFRNMMWYQPGTKYKYIFGQVENLPDVVSKDEIVRFFEKAVIEYYSWFAVCFDQKFQHIQSLFEKEGWKCECLYMEGAEEEGIGTDETFIFTPAHKVLNRSGNPGEKRFIVYSILAYPGATRTDEVNTIISEGEMKPLDFKQLLFKIIDKAAIRNFVRNFIQELENDARTDASNDDRIRKGPDFINFCNVWEMGQTFVDDYRRQNTVDLQPKIEKAFDELTQKYEEAAS